MLRSLLEHFVALHCGYFHRDSSGNIKNKFECWNRDEVSVFLGVSVGIGARNKSLALWLFVVGCVKESAGNFVESGWNFGLENVERLRERKCVYKQIIFENRAFDCGYLLMNHNWRFVSFKSALKFLSKKKSEIFFIFSNFYEKYFASSKFSENKLWKFLKKTLEIGWFNQIFFRTLFRTVFRTFFRKLNLQDTLTVLSLRMASRMTEMHWEVWLAS